MNMEGKRSWWGGRASNPVGDAMRRRVGSTPIPLRHLPSAIRPTPDSMTQAPFDTLDFPGDLHYLIEHQVWARLAPDGRATVGITSLGIALAGDGRPAPAGETPLRPGEEPEDERGDAHRAASSLPLDRDLEHRLLAAARPAEGEDAEVEDDAQIKTDDDGGNHGNAKQERRPPCRLWLCACCKPRRTPANLSKLISRPPWDSRLNAIPSRPIPVQLQQQCSPPLL